MKKILSLFLLIPAFSIAQPTMKKVDASSMWLRPNTPTLYPSTSSLTGFSTTAGTASSSQTFTLGGDNLTANASVSAPTYYEVSLSSGSGYGSSVSVAQSGGNITGEPVTIYVRITSAAPAGTPSGNITISSTGASNVLIAVSGTVTSPSSPDLSVSPSSLSGFVTTAGTASTAQTFTVSGTNLTGNATVTAPSSYEVSTSSGSGYGGSVSLTQSGGILVGQPITIYTRITAAAVAGTPSGNVTVASSGATTRNVALSGTVNASGGSADTTYSDTAQFNLNYATQSISGWQDLGPGSTSPHTAVKSGTQNGYTLSTNSTGAWNGLPATTSDTNGENTDDGGGFAHNATAQLSYMFHYNNGFTGATSDCQLKLSGATPGAWYVIDLLPSRDANVGGARYAKYILLHQDGQTEYTTFSNGAAINATGNTSKVVRMYGKANASGELYIYGGGTTNVDATTQYAYFNTVRVYKMTIE